MVGKKDYEIMAFPSAKAWEQWLGKNHADTQGVWLRFFKKASGTASVSYDEALLVALCFGWIDGQIKKHDEVSWIHKFVPRRPKSLWSKRNRTFVEQLIDAGKMSPSGLKEVEAAKSDGRWDGAYDSPSKMSVPKDFLVELAKNKKAKTFYETLNKANTYAITWRLQTAKKPETRQKRMVAILEMLAKGEKIH
jgi:uncharacterized protein YdeI (YjbR/CyaY-like superfamily)